MADAPIILVTQTKIIVPPTETVKPEKTTPAKRTVPTVKKVMVKPEPKKVKVKTPVTPKAEKPVKVSKAPVMKPASESGLAAKNQEAVKAGKIPSRLDVEPGRYDMLLS